MRWPFVETELHNSVVLGWLMPVLTLVACYYVGETLFASLILLIGVFASLFLTLWLNRPWWQQLTLFVWAVSPIAIAIADLRLRGDARGGRAYGTSAAPESQPGARATPR